MAYLTAVLFDPSTLLQRQQYIDYLVRAAPSPAVFAEVGVGVSCYLRRYEEWLEAKDH